MVSIRGEVEGRRERLIALVLLLQDATKAQPVTQEEIVRDLVIDEFPASSKGPRKIRAYDGSVTASIWKPSSRMLALSRSNF